MPDEIEIHYTSVGVKTLSDMQLMRLVLRAQMKNYRLGITGLMSYTDGDFFQIMEGERDVVVALFAKIAADPRHTNVVKTIERDLPRRNFKKWSLAYLNSDGKSSLG